MTEGNAASSVCLRESTRLSFFFFTFFLVCTVKQVAAGSSRKQSSSIYEMLVLSQPFHLPKSCKANGEKKNVSISMVSY